MKEARINNGLTPSFGELHANTIELEKHYELRPSSPAEESNQKLKPRKTVDLDDDDIDFVPAPITESHHYVENVLLLRPKVRCVFLNQVFYSSFEVPFHACVISNKADTYICKVFPVT